MTLLSNVIVTAYCACKLCCGPNAPNPTAIGLMPKQGITIAAPRNIKLGSRVIINGHTYIAQDRTAKRFDGRFDIYFNSHKDALKFGKQKLTVRILH